MVGFMKVPVCGEGEGWCILATVHVNMFLWYINLLYFRGSMNMHFAFADIVIPFCSKTLGSDRVLHNQMYFLKFYCI